MRWTRVIAGVAVLATCVVPTAARAADPSATPTATLFISEYVEGSSNNKAIEIYNAGVAPIDLSGATCQIRRFDNGSTNVGGTIALTGTVAAGGTRVIANTSAATTLRALDPRLVPCVISTPDRQTRPLFQQAARYVDIRVQRCALSAADHTRAARRAPRPRRP